MENARENLNIYEDVCDFDLGDEVEKLKTENENLQKHIRSLEDDIEKITATVVKLTEDQDTLKNNISTLYLTAKAEIERKDRMISELRTKVDNMCFRRIKPDSQNKREREDAASEDITAKKFKYDNNSKVTQERAQEEFDDKNQHSSAAGRWHSEGKECDVLEDNTAKEFKYDVSKGRKKDFDDNRQSGRAGSSHSEEKEGIVLEDNTDKKLKCNVGGEEGEVFDKHDSYRSGSLQSEERENIWEDNSTNKFKCDNFKERREEFYDKHRNRHRSRSRHPGDKYNNRGYRSRSKSWERNEFYYNDDRGRWYNHNDNFSFSDERAWKFGYRENWNDTRGVWENDVYGKYEHRHFGYRDSRGQHKQYFERAAHVKRESSPVHHTFSEREEKYEKPKEYNKLEVKSRNKEPSQRLTKSNTVQESSSIGTIRETTISEKEDVTKTKPKKRLKMLDEAEKKMRKLRATPIKSNNSWSEQIPSLTNNRLKEISRNITEEVDNGYRKDLKKCKPEIAGREDSKANKRSMKKISRRSTEEVNKKESLKKGDPDKILFIDLYDEDEEDQDLIIIDEFSNSNLDDEKFEKKEAVEKNKILSEDLTNNTIQDITYHLTNEGNNVYHFKQKDINSIDKHATVNLDAANTDKKIKGMSKVDLLNTRKKNRKVEERIKDVNKTKKSETNDGKYLNVNLNVGNSADDDKIFKNFSEENLSKSAKQVISLFGENTKGKNYVDKKRNVFVFEKSLNFGADNSTGNEMRDAKKFNKSPPKEDLSNTPKQSVKLNSCVKGVNKRVTYHQENINRTEDSSIVKMDAENTTKNRKREASKKIEILSNIRLDTEKNANVEMKNINQSVSCEKKEAKKKKNTPKDLSNTTNKEGKLSPKINIKNEKKNMQPKQQMSSIHLDDENTSKNKKITTRRKIKIANDDSTNSTKKDMNIVMEKKDVSLCDKKNVNVILDADYEPPKEENNSSSNTHVSNTTHENMETVEKQIMTDRGNVKKCSKQKIVIDIEDTSNVNRDVANTTDKKMESKEKIKSLSKEVLMHATKQDMDLIIEEVTEHKNKDVTRSEIQDKNTMEKSVIMVLDTGNCANYEKKQSKNNKSPNVDLLSTTKEDVKQVMKNITKDENNDCNESKKHDINDTDLNVNLDTDNLSKDEKVESDNNIKKLAKEVLTSTQQDMRLMIENRNKKERKPLKNSMQQNRNRIENLSNVNLNNEHTAKDMTKEVKVHITGLSEKELIRTTKQNTNLVIEENVKKESEVGNQSIKKDIDEIERSLSIIVGDSGNDEKKEFEKKIDPLEDLISTTKQHMNENHENDIMENKVITHSVTTKNKDIEIKCISKEDVVDNTKEGLHLVLNQTEKVEKKNANQCKKQDETKKSLRKKLSNTTKQSMDLVTKQNIKDGKGDVDQYENITKEKKKSPNTASQDIKPAINYNIKERKNMKYVKQDINRSEQSSNVVLVSTNTADDEKELNQVTNNLSNQNKIENTSNGNFNPGNLVKDEKTDLGKKMITLPNQDSTNTNKQDMEVKKNIKRSIKQDIGKDSSSVNSDDGDMERGKQKTHKKMKSLSEVDSTKTTKSDVEDFAEGIKKVGKSTDISSKDQLIQKVTDTCPKNSCDKSKKDNIEVDTNIPYDDEAKYKEEKKKSSSDYTDEELDLSLPEIKKKTKELQNTKRTIKSSEVVPHDEGNKYKKENKKSSNLGREKYIKEDTKLSLNEINMTSEELRDSKNKNEAAEVEPYNETAGYKKRIKKLFSDSSSSSSEEDLELSLYEGKQKSKSKDSVSKVISYNKKAEHQNKFRKILSDSSEEELEASSYNIKKKTEELRNSNQKDKSLKVVNKENRVCTPSRTDNIKKNKEVDSKASTSTTSSGETVDLKVMKFSGMQNILRLSVEEPETHSVPVAKETKGTKKQSENHNSGDICLAEKAKEEFKINGVSKVAKNEKSRKISPRTRVRKSEEYTSDSSVTSDEIESGQTKNTKLFDEKLDILIQNCINESNVGASKDSVVNSKKDETVNDRGNIPELTNTNKISNVNEKGTKTEEDNKIVNKDVISVFDHPRPDELTKQITKDVQGRSSGKCKRDDLLRSKDNVQLTVNKNSPNTTPEKTKTKRRITPTPVKDNKPICSFENILGKTSQSSFRDVSPLHLTHEGEIPVLHLEENHINNLPTETNINDKNIMSLLDTMNISNMECDIPKIGCETVVNSEANSGDSNVNISPIKGSNSLSFKNIINKVTSTPMPEGKYEKKGNSSSNVESDGCPLAVNISSSSNANQTASTGVRSLTNSTFQRRRRRCRLVILD